VLGFDLSFIPANAVIQNANLSLYAWDRTDGMGQHQALSGPNGFWLQRITSSWDEASVTWNHQPTVTTTNQAVLPESVSPTQDYTNIDVTAMVQDMVQNPSAGYGMLLRLQDEAYYRRVNFCSSDHPNPGLRPRLAVAYSTGMP
jgi:hypothetical protein